MKIRSSVLSNIMIIINLTCIHSSHPQSTFTDTAFKPSPEYLHRHNDTPSSQPQLDQKHETKNGKCKGERTVSEMRAIFYFPIEKRWMITPVSPRVELAGGDRWRRVGQLPRLPDLYRYLNWRRIV
ncbi:hypothetical protein Dimus_025396 [Dionaea muscipula]